MEVPTSPRPKLSSDQADTICRHFLSAGDAVFDYADELIRAGFSAFVPYWKFFESFCDDHDELQLHRKCVIEGAKNLLGRPWPFRANDVEERLLFRSPYLQRLTQERDEENGVPDFRLPIEFPGEIWRLEIDPCRRRYAFESVNNRQAHVARWNIVKQEHRRRLALEVGQHATHLARSHSFDRRRRHAFYTAVMKQHVGALGFEFDKLKSRVGFSIFSQQVGGGWDLCWVLEEPNSLAFDDFKGSFRPYLEIRHRNLKGSIKNAENGQFLIIRYDRAVPGFFNGYAQFFSLEELETIIKAHLCLYGLMAPIIEGGIHEVLGKEGHI